MDLNSGGPANALGNGSIFDIHSYPYPRMLVGAAPGQFDMIGVRVCRVGWGFTGSGVSFPGMFTHSTPLHRQEFGGIGAFVSGQEWVEGKCHTYLAVETPHEEAHTYISSECCQCEGGGTSPFSV